MINKKGQVTIFIIVAVILVAAVGGFFVVRGTIMQDNVPAEIQPIYNSFLSCVEGTILTGINLLESQGGYIELPEFEAGSNYMPFSSQLNFLGSTVPYWYYVSGNNIEREQIPTKLEMQEHLGGFIENQINNCDLTKFYEEGYLIYQGIPQASVNIKDNSVSVDLEMDLKVESSETTILVEDHSVSVDSFLGKLYENAKKVYEQEQEELFLETYGIDILRLYAPVDGVELTCSPKTWSSDQVFNELQEAIEENTITLKSKGGDYDISEEEEYFVINLDLDSNVEANFINSRDWPYSFEVNPSSGNFLVAEPIGIQPGLGILGFCYAPYHFIYDMKYPILVQISEDNEIFQFPFAVVIQGNNKREPFEGNASAAPNFELCENRNTPVSVNVYDSDLNSLEADISYECLGEICDIGKSPVSSNFPQCINGHVLARAEGYADAEFLFSTTNGGNAEIILEELHPINVNLKVDGLSSEESAVIYFKSEEDSQIIAYPEQKTINLISGNYDIEVYLYKDSSLEFEATTLEQCVDIPRGGVAGILGLKEESCIDVEMPEQLITNVLAGGGSGTYYVSGFELENYNSIELDVEMLETPGNIDQLYNNYLLFENQEVRVSFI
jgi:hypothetical protein